MSPDEEAAMRHFKGSIMRYVFEFFGTGCGFLVASTLSDADIQKIVIKEDDGQELLRSHFHRTLYHSQSYKFGRDDGSGILN